MPTTEKYLLASIASLMTTGLDSLANNANALGSEWDNTQGQAGDGYTLCDVEVYVDSFGGNVTAGGAVLVWFLAAPDGTNYEDGGAGVTPARPADVVLPLRSGISTAQRVSRRAWLPWGKLKPLVRNDATGQAMASSGNTLKVRPVTRQGV